jgi:hypothetical protein
MIAQTTTLHRIRGNDLKTRSFAEIFEQIKFDIDLRRLTTGYKNIPYEKTADRRDFKITNLPAFFPTVWLNQSHTNALTETAIPTGLVQFDLDAKDNLEVDFEAVTQCLLSIPELVYLFESPSSGLKFAIKTNFHQHPGDSIQVTRHRYQEAYRLTKSFILNRIPHDILLDDAVGTLKFACWMAHDPNAFFNPNSETLSIDDQCFCPEKPRQEFRTYECPSLNRVKELLAVIPRQSPYDYRVKINSAVFNSVGPVAINLLLGHWDTDQPEKLLRDVKYLTEAEHRTVHGIGYLYNEARKFGYPTPAQGRQRKSQVPRTLVEVLDETNQWIPPSQPVEEVRNEIKLAVETFIEKRQDTCIVSSGGIGKSQQILECLRTIPHQTKVLYICRDHQLIDELIRKFNSIPRQMKHTSSITHIRGRMLACERPDLVEDYKQAGAFIPANQCIKSCPLLDTCRYIKQFNEFGNIRMMTMNELNGTSSVFDKFSPDLIIIDEDWISIETACEDRMSPWQSIRDILDDCGRGVPLEQAIEDNHNQIIVDAIRQKRNRVIFRNTQQYLRDVKSCPPVSLVLAKLAEAVKTDSGAGNIYVDHDRLIFSRIKAIQEKYASVPKLFLDATANERIVKQILPGIHWIDLVAKKQSDIRIFQAGNFNVTKQWLSENHHSSTLADGLHRMIREKGYQNVGLITYLNIPGKQNFDRYLASLIRSNAL